MSECSHDSSMPCVPCAFAWYQSEIAHYRERDKVVQAECGALRDDLERAEEGVRYWTAQAQAEAADAMTARADAARLREALRGLLNRLDDNSEATPISYFHAERDAARAALGEGTP